MNKKYSILIGIFAALFLISAGYAVLTDSDLTGFSIAKDSILKNVDRDANPVDGGGEDSTNFNDLKSGSIDFAGNNIVKSKNMANSKIPTTLDKVYLYKDLISISASDNHNYNDRYLLCCECGRMVPLGEQSNPLPDELICYQFSGYGLVEYKDTMSYDDVLNYYHHDLTFPGLKDPNWIDGHKKPSADNTGSAASSDEIVDGSTDSNVGSQEAPSPDSTNAGQENKVPIGNYPPIGTNGPLSKS